MDRHQKMLKSLFNEVLVQEIAKRLKNPTLEEVDLIMYFGDEKVRKKMNDEIIPEMIRNMNIMNLIDLHRNFDSFLVEFSYAWWIIDKEIKKRKKMVE